jgi:DNA-binding NarL/FixJ family response regulator
VTPTPAWRCPPLITGTPVASITARQADVLAGICHGHSNVQIADRLYIAEDSVKTHVKRILRALGARNRAHAAALAASEQVVVQVRNDSSRRTA